MRVIDNVVLHDYKVKGLGIVGEFFFVDGLKVILHKNVYRSQRRKEVEVVNWCFEIVPTKKSKYHEALANIHHTSNAFRSKETCMLAAWRQAKRLVRKALEDYDVPKKAFIYYDDEDCVHIIYAVNASDAKRQVANNFQAKYIDIRVARAAWADGYGDMDKIPNKAWLKNGFGVACAKCGNHYYEDELTEINKEYFCLECAKRYK